MAGNVTRVLEAIPELFTREEARCSRCRDTKKVIRMNVEHGAAADAQMAACGGPCTMAIAGLLLTEQEQTALETMAQRTGKTPDDTLRQTA